MFVLFVVHEITETYIAVRDPNTPEQGMAYNGSSILSRRKKERLTSKCMPKGRPKITGLEGMDGLEFLREHPDLNTKPIRDSRLHKAPNDLCRGICEFFEVDKDRKVVCHAVCFSPKQPFRSFVNFDDDFRFLAMFRLWPGRFQEKDIL